MKAYIAGQITGDPNYRQKFAEARKAMESVGFTVLNPADYMRVCFAMMDSVDVVAFLPDYEQSRGAQLEWAWCQYTGKTTMYLAQMTFYRESVDDAVRLSCGGRI